VRGESSMTRLRRLPLTAHQKVRVLSHKGRAGSLLLRLHQACGFLAATLSVRPKRGVARRKAQTYGVVPCGTRAPLGAPAAAFFQHRAPLSVADSGRSVSQLLAGTRDSGPGGSPDAARVPRCDEARRRRTPPRLTTPHENAPSEGRGAHSVSKVWREGISLRDSIRTRAAQRSGVGDPAAAGAIRLRQALVARPEQ